MKWTIGIVLALALGCFVLYPIAPARDVIKKGLYCGNVWRSSYCQSGMQQCAGTIGADCSWCAVAPTDYVKDCVEGLPADECHYGENGDPLPCGRLYSGTCIDDGNGGTVCHGTSQGDCPNTVKDKCHV